MEKFNPTNFISFLKKEYDAIPVKQGDQAVKVLVSDAILAGKFNPEEVFSFICDKMGNPSVKLDDAGWKTIIKRAIKNGGLIGKCLEVCAGVRKDKVSYEDLFSSVVSRCGGNPDYLKKELYCNSVVGWKKVAETLVKSESTKTVETKTEKKVVVKKEKKSSSIKTQKMDPRCKSITLTKDGVKKEWASYRDCEKEVGAGHGSVSQYLSGKLKSVKGWVLPKEEEKTPMESKKQKRSKSKGVIQMKMDKNGNLEVVSTYSSLTEAAKATGVSHSGISKTCSGTYQSSGGYVWKVAEAAVA